MTKAMQQHPEASAVLVRRHGIYVWAPSWQKAKTMYVWSYWPARSVCARYLVGKQSVCGRYRVGTWSVLTWSAWLRDRCVVVTGTSVVQCWLRYFLTKKLLRWQMQIGSSKFLYLDRTKLFRRFFTQKNISLFPGVKASSIYLTLLYRWDSLVWIPWQSRTEVHRLRRKVSLKRATHPFNFLPSVHILELRYGPCRVERRLRAMQSLWQPRTKKRGVGGWGKWLLKMWKWVFLFLKAVEDLLSKLVIGDEWISWRPMIHAESYFGNTMKTLGVANEHEDFFLKNSWKE